MSEPEPVCPICGGLCRREILRISRRFPGIRYGPWRCDIHGEVTPVWEEPIEDNDEEGGRK